MMADPTSPGKISNDTILKSSREYPTKSMEEQKIMNSAAIGCFSIDSPILDANKKTGIGGVTSCEALGVAPPQKEPSSMSLKKSFSSVKPRGIRVVEEDECGTLAYCESHGMVSVIGRRRWMEDAVTVVPGVAVGEFGCKYGFFAVYDGHGGAKVANACRDRMHQIVAEEVEKGKCSGGGKGLEYWEKVMKGSFEKMDEEVMVSDKGGGSSEESDVKNMGSTAVVVLVGKEEVVVANCGDSRAVLCRDGVPVPLSCDHKPDRPDEQERVKAAGGQVINWNGSRVLGVLATSRSIGDQNLKPFVISEPEVTVTDRTDSDEFIIIATDGLWDVVSNKTACKIARMWFYGRTKQRRSKEYAGSTSCSSVGAATLITELAIARGSKDNISVIIIRLRKRDRSV